MRPKAILVVSLLFSIAAHAQLPSSSFSYSCVKDTVIECGPTCTTLRTQIPNIKSATDNYVVNKACFRPPLSPGLPGTSVNFDADDMYSPAIFLPFTFPFYGMYYDALVTGSNGTISFDLTNASGFSDWQIPPNAVLPSNSFDRAVIMFPFHDVDIRQTTSPNRQIKMDMVGTAPHRKWVLSFYKIPLFSCMSLIENTYQLVLNEATGIVEMYVHSRQVCNSWNGGRAIIGMQAYDFDKGITAPGRSASDANWGSVNMNEAWRFTPAGGRPLLKKTELYSINGNFIANGDTADAGNGILNVSFNNVCVNATTTYIVKSSYYNHMYFLDPSSWTPADGDSMVYATDTINAVRLQGLPLSVSVISADCSTGAGGRITVASPIGPLYTYSIDNSPFQASPIFSEVVAGAHIISVLDNASGCISSSVPVMVGEQNSTMPSLNYPQSTYCNTQSQPANPVLTNGPSGGLYSSQPNGLNIDQNTGVVTLLGSDTGLYTIFYTVTNPPSCNTGLGYTTLRIADNSKFVWTGASGNAWENADNWSCNTLPTSTSDVFIYDGDVVINSNVTVNSLMVAPGASVTVSPGSNLTVLHP